MLDGGSTVTVGDKKLVGTLGLSGQPVNMLIQGLWGGEKHSQCERMSFNIIREFGEQAVEHALAVSQMDLPTQTLYREITNQIERNVEIKVEPFKNAKPLILIGQDNWRLMNALESLPVEGSGLVVTRTLLGWVVHGYYENKHQKIRAINVHATCCATDCGHEDQIEKSSELDELFRQYFVLENLGVSKSFAKKDQIDRASKILHETTRKIGKTWETGLLWKHESLPALDTRSTALRRLRSLEKRQDRNPLFAAAYHREMSRLIDNGYAVKAGQIKNPARVRDISHFGVTNPNKPGKLRLVFDAAEKTNGISMNDLLDTGPDLLESLLGVLMRFRQYPFAVMADIKDMYLRVKVIEKDRESQRFLYRGLDRKQGIDEWEMTCLIFGSKSSPCSALYVKNTNAKQFERTKPEAARSIVKNSYMDDYLASGNDANRMRQLVRDVSMINREASFEMHGWASNNEDIVADVKTESKLGSNEQASLCKQEDRVLGLYWDRNADSLRFNVGMNKIKNDTVTGTRKPTKREVLSVAMSVFDPLGILSPFTLIAKLIIQDIWISATGWDAQIRDEEFAKWQTWTKNLLRMKDCTIARSFLPIGTDYANTQLHIFCDASKKAYATIAYLRITARDGTTHIALVMAKTRVAPVKPMTIPRLELQAALLGARVATTIGQELDIKVNERIFWTDSTTVLHWIKSGPRTKQIYVANRLGEINASTRANEWRYVPTELNPADDGTRPSNKPMCSTDRWLIGPRFLQEPTCEWPTLRGLTESEKREAENLEARKEFIGMLFVNKPKSWEITAKTGMSRWYKIVNVAESLRNFFKICGRKAREKRGESTSHIVEIKENPMQQIIAAEKFWYRLIQAACFPNELEALKKDKELPKGSKLIALRPFIDNENILRARGRVSKLFDSKTGKRKLEPLTFENTPIILDASHYATNYLIEMYHERYDHANNETVVNELRQQFYIIGLRTRLRWLVKRCITCRVQRAKPQNPPMADLPECRVAYGLFPFTYCGIDYFGPMIIKIGRRREKRWGVLFTCMTTRAIHIELASTLSASSTIMAIQRLAARRGFPHKMFSDNGTNFVKASKELKDAINEIDTKAQQEYAKAQKFTWTFNPPDAPHMGGVWERLIRSVKVALDHALNGQSCSEEVLLTLLAEIEHMVNSRPLTHVSIDPNDQEALTPNHFLIGRSSGFPKVVRFEQGIANPRRTFEIAQNLAQGFWKRWLREYLPTMLPRKKWHKSTTPHKNGDIVLILDHQTPRNTWKTGKIIETFENKSDGVVRAAKIQIGNNTLVRPVHKLIKLIVTESVKKSVIF